jgi:hypothetical protein
LRRPTLCFLLASLAFAYVAGPVPADAGEDFPRFFGAEERRSDDIAPFTNWTQVVARAHREMTAATVVCAPGSRSAASRPSGATRSTPWPE